jgi:hypothetical protein
MGKEKKEEEKMVGQIVDFIMRHFRKCDIY